jgi:hypothetical protein
MEVLMSTDVISILADIALFIIGVWIVFAFTAFLVDLLGYILIAAAIITLFRLVRSRGA